MPITVKPVAVKICGLRTEEAIEAALEAGAAYVGLVFYPRSPRHVDLPTAARLANLARGRAKIVALTVDADDSAFEGIISSVAPDMLQLHGAESVERVRAVRAKFGLLVLKAITIATAVDVESAQGYRTAADLILFDAKPPRGLPNALPGGNGAAFDWRLLDGVKDRFPFMLSGGLTPETVVEAVRITGAKAVDVSSGVEIRPGEKDPALIRRFLRAAHDG